MVTWWTIYLKLSSVQFEFLAAQYETMLIPFLYFGVLDKYEKLYLNKTNVYMTIWELGILVIDGKVYIF